MASQFVLLVQLFFLITAVHRSIETKCSTTIRANDIWHKKLDYIANVIGGYGANHSMDCISGFGCMTFTCADEEDNAQFVINSCASSKDKCYFSRRLQQWQDRIELEEASDCCLAFC
uniref:Secreted protein n=1 Tax=Globodera pallida TaxID=36090 RepID=A0A183BUN4_GLOPA